MSLHCVYSHKYVRLLVYLLTLCMLGIFGVLLSSAVFFFKINNLLNKLFQEIYPRLDQRFESRSGHSVSLDLGPICL